VGRQSARDQGIDDSDDEEGEEAATRSDASGLERMQAELEALQAELDAKGEGESMGPRLETGPLNEEMDVDEAGEEESVSRKVGSEEWLQEKTRFFPPGRVMHIVRGSAGTQFSSPDHGFQAEGSGDVNVEKSPGDKSKVPLQFSFAGELMRAWRPQPLVDARSSAGSPKNPEGVPSIMGGVTVDLGGEIEVDVEPAEEGLPLSSGFGSPIEIEDRSKVDAEATQGKASPSSRLSKRKGNLEKDLPAFATGSGLSREEEPFVLHRRCEIEDQREDHDLGGSSVKRGLDQKSERREGSQTAHHSQSGQEEESIYRLYHTDKKLYGKIWLSRSMVMDHYMPHYRRCLQEVLLSLEHEQERQAGP
jgi:hypothetical protein